MRPYFNTPLGILMPLGVPKNIAPLAAAGLGALFSVGASAAGSGISNWINAGSSAEAFRRQKELQQNQQDFERSFYNEMFEKESSYNSPVEQMKRYEAAGLNPYLLSRNQSMIGSGVTAPSAPSAPSVSSVAPTAPVGMDFASGMSAIPQLLASQSQIKRNDAESFSKIVDSLPELGRSLGWDKAREVASEMLGILGSTNSQYERQMNSIISGLESEARSKAVRATLDEAFGYKNAEQKWSLGEQALSESFARIGKMSSDRAVNDATIKKLASDIVRNVADAWKLQREGDYYVANASTVNALREFVVSQARSKANMLSTSSYLSGSESDTDIYDFVHSGRHAKGVVGQMKNLDYLNGDNVGFWVDRFFNDYVKILGSPASHGGSSVTTTTVYE